MEAFDSDVLIYLAKKDSRGDRAARLVGDPAIHCIGSVVLRTELLGFPADRVNAVEEQRLVEVLAAIDLKDVDDETAQLAGVMRSKYRLGTADALHLATAVLWGAERFHTNNSKDFAQQIDEIEVALR